MELNPKQHLRAEIKARLARLTPDDVRQKSVLAEKRLVESPAFQNARVVLAYDAFGAEPHTEAIIEQVLSSGRILALPRTISKESALQIHAVTDVMRETEKTRFGFREPLATLPGVKLDEIDLILVPGLGFDPHGARLGRGGGYYDRFLALPGLRATLCALAFDVQIETVIPTEPHDRAVALIFTESRTITCA